MFGLIFCSLSNAGRAGKIPHRLHHIHLLHPGTWRGLAVSIDQGLSAVVSGVWPWGHPGPLYVHEDRILGEDNLMKLLPEKLLVTNRNTCADNNGMGFFFNGIVL